MTSKVLVKLPTVPFSQGKKSTPELVALPAKSDGPAQVRSPQIVNGDRTAQLEQNMKFLQEQHQATLMALHQEVETLRQRNRDLQFQLVFTKSTNCVQSSSSEDNSNGFVKNKDSPLRVNVTPVQAEPLEKKIDEIKTAFNVLKKHNQHLLAIVDERAKFASKMCRDAYEKSRMETVQSAKPEQSEKRKEKLETADVGVQVNETVDTTIQDDLAARVEDAEAMVKRLRRENIDHQKEIATIKAASMNRGNGNGSGSGRGRGHDSGHHYREGAQGNPEQEANFPKFPSLQTRSYRPGGARGSQSFDHNTTTFANSKCLPHLRNSNSKPKPWYYSSFCPSRGYRDEGGDYYKKRDNRKGRGQRAPRDTEGQDHRRDLKETKNHHQRDTASSATTTATTDNSHAPKKQ